MPRIRVTTAKLGVGIDDGWYPFGWIKARDLDNVFSLMASVHSQYAVWHLRTHDQANLSQSCAARDIECCNCAYSIQYPIGSCLYSNHPTFYHV